MVPDLCFRLYDMTDLAEEEAVDGSPYGDAFHVASEAEQLGDGIDAIVRTDPDVVEQFLPAYGIELGQMDVVCADFQGTDAFQQAFLKGAAHAHHFSGGLHLGGQGIVGVCEFIEGETRQLGHHIIQRRLERRGGVRQLNLIQRHADTDLGGYPGEWISACFGGQGGGTGHPGVHFDEIILEGIGVQGELHVAPAFNFKGPDDLQGAVPQHMVFFVGQGLGRADHD